MVKIREFLGKMINPHAQIVGPERYTARLISGMALSVVIVASLIIFIALPIQIQMNLGSVVQDGRISLFADPVFWVGLIAIVVFLLAYSISRTVQYQIASWIIIAVFIISTYASAIYVPDPQSINAFLMYATVPIFLVSIFENIRRITLVVVIVIMIEIGVPYVFGSYALEEVMVVVPYQILVSLVVIVAKIHRDNLETVRQRELEDSLKIAKKARVEAEEASRLKTEFLANVSHELRTPLNAIIGFADIIDLSAQFEKGVIRDGELEQVGRIRSNAKRLLAIINDILDLAKIDRRIELVPRPFDVRKLVLSVENEMRSLASGENLEFETSVEDDLPDVLIEDEHVVVRIMTNLLSNAFKFTEEGSVNLSVFRIGEAKWGFTVSDTGIGIDRHHQMIIFDEFRQVDGTTKRKHGGTGLGLALVDRWTRAMKGSINVESELGKGSNFTVVLPLNIPKSEKSEIEDEVIDEKVQVIL